MEMSNKPSPSRLDLKSCDSPNRKKVMFIVESVDGSPKHQDNFSSKNLLRNKSMISTREFNHGRENSDLIKLDQMVEEMESPVKP